MKKILMLVAASLCMLAMGCATLTVPVSATGEQLGPKVGEASGIIILNVFGTADASIRTAARNAGITQVTSVDLTRKMGFLGLWTTYTVTVTGN